MKTVAQSIAERVSSFRVEAMSNLRPSRTGVEGAVIWISAGEFSGTEAQHGPRIKVVLGDKVTTEGLREAVSVRISVPPEVLGTLPGGVKRDVFRFIELNRGTLLLHWRGELDSAEAIERLVRV